MSSIATVVAVAPPLLKEDTAAVLGNIRRRSAVRTILVTLGDDPQPDVNTADEATIIEGLAPRFLNNAVASLRLSSLPSLAWWRGGDPALLGDLAELVDRLVLDAADPAPGWAVLRTLRERSATSDLRWTRLTRWRNLMAQFFDLPDVRAAAARFSAVEVSSSDDHAARLFAAWLSTRLPRGGDLRLGAPGARADTYLESVTLRGDGYELGLRLLPNRSCIETCIQRAEHPAARRVVPLGDQSTAALLAEELRIRSRDFAFEQAIDKVVT